jgi:hypothetical protein
MVDPVVELDAAQPARPGRGVPAVGRGRTRVGRRGKMWLGAQGADTARARSARRRSLWVWRCMRRRPVVGG